MMLSLRKTLRLGAVLTSGLLAVGLAAVADAGTGSRPRIDADAQPAYLQEEEPEEGVIAQASYTQRVKQERVPMRPPLSSLQRRPANGSNSRPANYRPGSRSMVTKAAHRQPMDSMPGMQGMGGMSGMMPGMGGMQGMDEVIETPMSGSMQSGSMRSGETVYEDGGMVSDDYLDGGDYMDDGSYGDGYYDDYGGGYFGGDCMGDCFGCCLPQLPCFNNFQVFGGVNGFTGPANRGGTGSFGFFEGLNFSNHFPFSRFGLSYQVGAMATQNNFSGTNFTLDDRNQVFVTGGIFRRVDCGLQGGVVVDYMHDSFYYSVDLVQLRYEFSWVYDGQQEVGFWGTSGTQDALTSATFRTTAGGIVNRTTENFEVVDIYSAFYRRYFCNGGYGRVWGGFTNQSDGILGADVLVPLTTCVDVTSSFTYLVPNQGINDNGVGEEAWNVFVGLVWYPGCMRRNECPYDRPLFNVANNGSFLVDRTQQ